MCHDARLDLINRHFRITRSDWSITLSGRSESPRYVTPPHTPPRARDNTYFFTGVRGFPGTYRRWSSHHLRPRCNYRWVDDATSPDVHETFVSLHFRDGRRITKSRRKSPLFPPWMDCRWSTRAFILPPRYFSIILDDEFFGQNELLAPIASTAYFFFFFFDTRWNWLNTPSFTSKRATLAFFKGI